MPRISQEQKQYYKPRTRSVLAQYPQATQRALQERLKADGLELDRLYLASLLKSIQLERVKRLNAPTLNYALPAFHDVMMETTAVRVVNSQRRVCPQAGQGHGAPRDPRGAQGHVRRAV